MEIPDTNLRHLFLNIPTQYKKGKPQDFTYKSIADILTDKDIFELVYLQDWISEQILRYIGWDLKTPITSENIAQAFELFSNLNIVPTGCIYSDDDIITDSIKEQKVRKPDGTDKQS